MNKLSKKISCEFLNACEAIQGGKLRVETPDGERLEFGNSGDAVHLKLNDWQAISLSLSRGDIGFGEAYVKGLWDSDTPEALLKLMIKNRQNIGDLAKPSKLQNLKFRVVDQLMRRNSVKGSRRNIRAHYDVGNEFYMLWLDPSMTYSSAIFGEGDDLETAQMRKYDRILGRLGHEGENILEIGCGWGGFAKRAAQSGRHVTGLTLSPNQKGYADAILDGDAKIQLQDYRHSVGKYDHIVSIEMIEAVGERYWLSYFSTIKSRLKEGGKAVIQAITVENERFNEYRKKSDFIRHYTFPGGMLLCNREIEKAANKTGLNITDNFAFGQHYARTCRLWSSDLMAAKTKIHKLGYDEQFLRGWQYYLDACAASFAIKNSDVVQVELQHA